MSLFETDNDNLDSYVAVTAIFIISGPYSIDRILEINKNLSGNSRKSIFYFAQYSLLEIFKVDLLLS